MAQDTKNLTNLRNDIRNYRDNLPAKKLINDQSNLRRSQAAELLNIIADALTELNEDFRPEDSTDEINKIISSCNQTTIIGKSRLSRHAAKLKTCLAAYQHLPARYSHIQCIGFYADISATSGQDTGLGEGSSWARTMKYAGDATDMIDIDAKLNRFTRAIAKAEFHADKRPSVLKVMMGPEFYLRGAKGAYELGAVADILSDLRKVTNNKKFEHWIFIPGTAIAALPNTSTESEILNVALVQQGGFSEADGQHEAMVYKEYVSGIDFLSANKNPHDFNDPKGGTNPLFRKAVLDGSVKTLRATEGSRDKLSDYELKVRDLCHFISDLKPEPKKALCAAINEFFKNNQFSPANIRTAYDILGKAITAKYPMEPDKLGKFRSDIMEKMGVGLVKIGENWVTLGVECPLIDYDQNIAYKVMDEDAGGLAGGSIFKLCGVRFGLEVCLDHIKGRMKAAVTGTGNIKKIDPVDVHLIPSAGMSIDDRYVGAKANGIIFNVDGFRPLVPIVSKNPKYPTKRPAVDVKTANSNSDKIGPTTTTEFTQKQIFPVTVGSTDRVVVFNRLKIR